MEANRDQGIAKGTFAVFRDINVPFRCKLYFTQPIIDF